MKKQFMTWILAGLSLGAMAEGKLLKHWNFESSEGMMKWPEGTTVELDEEEFKQGKKSIVFTPDNGYCVYFYTPVAAGKEYSVNFWYKADKTPIKRCGVLVNFAKPDGGNNSAGSQLLSLSDICEPDNQWHQANFKFTAPPDAVKAQIQLAFYRTNATVFIDDFKFYDESVTVEKPTIPTAPVSTGQLVKAVDFSSATGLTLWPTEAKLTLTKDEEIGRNFVSFTPANNYSVYWYMKPLPGKIYAVEFLFRANGDAIKRCGFSLFFTAPGGKRGDLGIQEFPLVTMGDSNGNWRPASFKFTVPANTATCQFMLNFYRCNIDVDIADLKIFQE